MKNEKLKKAEALLDAVGEIDDIYLDEALAYGRRKRVSSRVLVIAATLALSLTLVVFAAVGLRFVSDPDLNTNAPSAEDGADKPQTSDSLGSLMLSLSDREDFTHIESETDLPYTSGKAYLVWQYEGESGYYLSEELSYSELNSIKSQVGKGAQVGGDSPTLKCRVWILLGDGRVVSPYLKGSAGNISNAVFNYEAEITPTEELVDRIYAILS